ncbi:MAG: methylenetetrahydrofolate--tRNA-(uracil(54)-C(5))-methyltransferase (FADH(2)-oxidizing) TrmFO [Trueperaceae bacterium]|nr:methylenetetrahydrofolate--tRNA-(uracil(54)-C(5))-methyltransferase (FADH(2)-oxidizing) TrmFO [Trueperaceae bacterium]|tara:strand:- start:47 stop:1336 length:1290 start_codon:yes stop_codon:yes gene_type:complete
MAGSDAAVAAARIGVKVDLYEMRPNKMTPAHHTDRFAELVCSNSFGGQGISNAKGLLQAEMLAAGGLIISSAHSSRVPAGGALAVDRDSFSTEVTSVIERHSNITVHRKELKKLPPGIVVIASGPLTSESLAEAIQEIVGEKMLGFFDAASPVISHESVNMDVAFRKGRYDQTADYLNLPFNEEEYRRFYQALSKARKHVPHDWEKLEFFEGCIPIEELARRGYDTPRFGPMKPVGLEDPKSGERHFAVAQLRQEDTQGQMWSLVGFQTGLKWPDQKEILELIPGLENVEIVRYGVMHRNTYLNAPSLLRTNLALRANPRIFVAGVLAGTEGYLESSATGWLAGTNAALAALKEESVVPPEETMLGGLVRFLSTAETNNFQPMNANWGLVPAIGKQRGVSRKQRREKMFHRGYEAFRNWVKQVPLERYG